MDMTPYEHPPRWDHTRQPSGYPNVGGSRAHLWRAQPPGL